MAANSSDQGPKVIPAQLSFLSIYNPTLGTTDETFQDQVVFYYSRAARLRKRSGAQDEAHDRKLQDEENEKLRQIGLAQGMVNFGQAFSGGKKIDHIDTEKSRIVLHELEPDWWIIASIDLTQIPLSLAPGTTPASNDSPAEPKIEFSSREVSPASVLISQLTRAHSIFLLHHGSSLRNLFGKTSRTRLLGYLDRFWTRFALSWDVLLHGAPIVDALAGIKLAAGGELGMGVGEEEWGSGEREVLEDFARRTLGLVDLIVSRFGDPAPETKDNPATKGKSKDSPVPDPWMGTGQHPLSDDGVVFSGMGDLARTSTESISHWMRWIYERGEQAYGVRDNPSSDRRKRKRKPAPEQPDAARNINLAVRSKSPTQQENNPPPGIPKPIFSAVERSLDAATTKADKGKAQAKPEVESTEKAMGQESDKWTKYLTLGYGSVWGPSDHSATSTEPSDQLHELEPKIPAETLEERIKAQIAQENSGHFLIGLKGDLEDDSDEIVGSDDESSTAGWNRRILIRTVFVEMASKGSAIVSPSGSSAPQSPRDERVLEETDSDQTTKPVTPQPRRSQVSRLRVLIYVHRPFIYALLFDHSIPSLSMPPFYRDTHTFLAPLQPLLARRTGSASAKLRAKAHGLRVVPGEVWDVICDPIARTVCANIPSIPSLHVGSLRPPESWSRADALNVHSALLEVMRSTRPDAEGGDETERSIKTGRGWWIVRMRVNGPGTPPPATQDGTYFDTRSKDRTEPEVSNVPQSKEVFLVRRSRDAKSSTLGGSSRSSSGWGFGSGDKTRLDSGMGIGFDARRYVEGLVGLGR